MRGRGWAATALAGAVLLAAGCTEEDRTGPGRENVPPGFRRSSSVLDATGTCLAPPSGMTGWWPGDGNTDDIVGGRNAVLHDNATTGAGFVGQAFVLDGAGDFVDVPHDPALNVGTGDFTVDLWVLFNTTEGEQILVEKWIQRFDTSPEASEGWLFTKLDGNVLAFGGGDGLALEGGALSDVLSIPTGTWIHFAASRQGDFFKIYMNGAQVAQGPSSHLNLNSESSLKFGHRGNPDDTPGSEDTREFFLNGRIDEVELFVGRALTDAEIAGIFAAGSAGKCKENAVKEVEVDIKPGNAQNPVNPKSQGELRVAILTTPDFNAADVDPATITLGDEVGSDTPVRVKPNGTLQTALRDVDGDRDLDRVLFFSTRALAANGDLTRLTTELLLRGQTTAGTSIRGVDAVRVVP